MNTKGSAGVGSWVGGQLFEEAIQAYLEAKECGTADKDELLLRYAGVAAELRDFFAAQETIGAMLVPPTTLKPEATPGGAAAEGPQRTLEPFGHYSDLELLSNGGMGSVYRCRDTNLGRPLALKVMHAHLARVPDLVRDFQAEARVASQLTHPNIAPLHELGWLPDQRPYFTMKLVEGRTLGLVIRDYHADKTAERFDALLRYFVAVCNALAYAHQRHVLHRDLKPANVMVGEFDEVLVLDWGLSKVVPRIPTGGAAAAAQPASAAVCTGSPEVLTEEGLVRGTFAYMPPDQANATGPIVDSRCDVFALGAVLCEILTGTPPYTSCETDPKLRREELWTAARTWATDAAFARLDASGAPAELLVLAKRCLARQPGERPASATAVAEGVTAYLAGVQEKLRAAEVERVRAETKVVEQSKRFRWQIAVAALALLAVSAGLSTWQWLRSSRERRGIVATRKLAESLGQVAQLREQARPLPDMTVADCKIALGIWRQGQAILEQSAAFAADAEPHAQQERNQLQTDFSAAIAPLDIKMARLERAERLTQGLREAQSHAAWALNQRPEFSNDRTQTVRAIRKTLEDDGIDAARMSPEEVASKFREFPAQVLPDVVLALDTWADIDRSMGDRLVAVNRLIDPSPWDRAVRDAATKGDRDAVLRLAHSLSDEKCEGMLVVSVATELAAAGDVPLAIAVLKEARKRRPGDYWIHVKLAALYSGARPPDFVEAVASCRAALAVQPDNARLMACLGRWLSISGESDEGTQWLRQSLQVDPKCGWAILYTAQNALFRGDTKEVDQLLLRLHAIHYQDAATTLLDGVSRFYHGDVRGGLDLLERDCQEYPNDSDAMLAGGLAAALQGDFAKAAKYTLGSVAADPNREAADLIEALGLFLAGDTAAAEQLADRYCQREKRGSSHDAMNAIRAISLISLGKEEEAETIVREMLRNDPKNLVSQLALYIVLIARVKPDEARAAAEEIQRAAPQISRAYLSTQFILLGLFSGGEALYRNLCAGGDPPKGFFAEVQAGLYSWYAAEYALAHHDGPIAVGMYLAISSDPFPSTMGWPTIATGRLGFTNRMNGVRAYGCSLGNPTSLMSPELSKRLRVEDFIRTAAGPVALAWFRDDIKVQAKRAKDPAGRPQAKRVLNFYQQCPDLAPLRDGKCEKLSAEDRKKWKDMFSEVNNLLESLRTPLPGEPRDGPPLDRPRPPAENKRRRLPGEPCDGPGLAGSGGTLCCAAGAGACSAPC